MRQLWAVACVLLIAGCSGTSEHKIDRDAWAEDLAGVGQTVADWSKMESAIKAMCDNDDLATLVAVGLDQGQSLDEMRIDFQNVCPDKVDDLEQAITEQRNSVADVELACDLPPEQRTDTQRDLAEAMGC